MKEIRVRMAYGMPVASGAGTGVRLETENKQFSLHKKDALEVWMGHVDPTG